MNRNLTKFIEARAELAERRGLNWHVALDATGRASKEAAWDLTTLTGSVPPPVFRLRDFNYENKALAFLNQQLEINGSPALEMAALPNEWQDLIKAVAIDGCVIKRNKANHVLNQVIRPLRIVATAAVGAGPSDLTREQVELAIWLATSIQPRGTLASLTESAVRHVIDYRHLANRSPLLPAKPKAKLSNRVATQSRKDTGRTLRSRRDAEKLPDHKAFWELIRIVFTEKPKSFSDALRFVQLKLLILTGLRVGEVTSLPQAWKQTKEYLAIDGQPAGEHGGISQSIALKYFGEKQGANDSERQLLYPQIQHIPSLYEKTIEDCLAEAERLTEPLRETLQKQCHSDRLLPTFSLDEDVPVCDLLPYLSGNPYIYEDPDSLAMLEEYKNDFDPKWLQEIERFQRLASVDLRKLRNDVRVYFTRMRRDYEGCLPCRQPDGSLSERMNYADGRFRIGDVEDFMVEHMPTKIADKSSIKTTDGETLAPYQFLFIGPKRAVISERNDGALDVRKYFSVGRLTAPDLMRFLGDVKGSRGGETIFMKYAERDEDRKLTMNTHSLRHLQNTELFRLGIADTIITKRFGRRSVAQSHEYDHRTLAEELESVSVPETAEQILPDKARDVFRLIKSGKISGPIVAEFRHIQAQEGEDAAFRFLAGEADGFHSTPYGYCINSFTVDPCPKHLECFNGCRHLSISDMPEHRTNLETLRNQLHKAVRQIEEHPGQTIGREIGRAHV